MSISRKVLSALLIFAASITLLSCGKDDPVPELDQEVITEVTLTFTEVDAAGSAIGTPMIYQATSAEGIALDGTVEIDDIDGLEAGKRYSLDITAYNGIADEDITEEIEEAADEHQFFFLGSAFVGSTATMEYAYDDQDENGNPIGLSGYVTVDETLASNTGDFRIVLRHALDKNHEGAGNPHWTDFVQAGGESDLDITFNVTY